MGQGVLWLSQCLSLFCASEDVTLNLCLECLAQQPGVCGPLGLRWPTPSLEVWTQRPSFLASPGIQWPGVGLRVISGQSIHERENHFSLQSNLRLCMCVRASLRPLEWNRGAPAGTSHPAGPHLKAAIILSPSQCGSEDDTCLGLTHRGPSKLVLRKSGARAAK